MNMSYLCDCNTFIKIEKCLCHCGVSVRVLRVVWLFVVSGWSVCWYSRTPQHWTPSDRREWHVTSCHAKWASPDQNYIPQHLIRRWKTLHSIQQSNMELIIFIGKTRIQILNNGYKIWIGSKGTISHSLIWVTSLILYDVYLFQNWFWHDLVSNPTRQFPLDGSCLNLLSEFRAFFEKTPPDCSLLHYITHHNSVSGLSTDWSAETLCRSREIVKRGSWCVLSTQ